MLRMFGSMIKNQISSALQMHGDFDFDQMFAAQWAAMTITTSPYIGISPSAPAVQSYSDLDTAMKGQGEFGYF